jgi:hypothetical protein
VGRRLLAPWSLLNSSPGIDEDTEARLGQGQPGLSGEAGQAGSNPRTYGSQSKAPSEPDQELPRSIRVGTRWVLQYLDQRQEIPGHTWETWVAV